MILLLALGYRVYGVLFAVFLSIVMDFAFAYAILHDRLGRIYV